MFGGGHEDGCAHAVLVDQPNFVCAAKVLHGGGAAPLHRPRGGLDGGHVGHLQRAHRAAYGGGGIVVFVLHDALTKQIQGVGIAESIDELHTQRVEGGSRLVLHVHGEHTQAEAVLHGGQHPVGGFGLQACFLYGYVL